MNMRRIAAVVLSLALAAGCNSPLHQDYPLGDLSRTNPNNMLDTDGDGLSDSLEMLLGTDPAIADTDGDGLSDGEEYAKGTNPLFWDSDGDGISDGEEINLHQTDPNNRDGDGDGLSDGEEINLHQTDPNNRDGDGDGLSDGEELDTYHTDPKNPDSDNDGFPDGGEVTSGTDPNNAGSAPADNDHNGLPDEWENLYPGIGGGDADYDQDGLSNRDEWLYGTDPTEADTDGDGASDGDEVHIHHTDPQDAASNPQNNGGLAASKVIRVFFITGPVEAQGVINEGARTITVNVPFGTNVSGMTTSVSHSGVALSPASGTVQDFSQPVDYTVTAQDGSTQVYKVTVQAGSAGSKTIRTFELTSPVTAPGILNEGARTITVNVPFGTELTAMTAVVSHTGASINPASGTAQDFSSPVNYTVSAGDGSSQTYRVTVRVGSNSAKDISAFSIISPVEAEGVIEGTTVTVNVPFGTDLTSMATSISHTGTSISPASGASRNFSNPRSYTVSAADGSTQTYTVRVETGAPPNSKDLTAFSIMSPRAAEGTINGTDITVPVPYGLDLSAMTASITHTGVLVSPDPAAARDYTGPVEYTVSAADGSTQVYTVRVQPAPSNARDITDFSITSPVEAEGTIRGTAVTVPVPYGTNLSAMTASITHMGAAVSPDPAAARDYSAPVEYMVTAVDGSTKVYTVTVQPAASNAKDMTAFSITSPVGAEGTIRGTAVTVPVPYGTSLSGMTASITHTGVSISPDPAAARDYTAPVEYTVSAADGGTKVYTVTVQPAASNVKDMTAFSIISPVVAEGTISGTDITVSVPYGTSLSAMTASITHTGAAVSPDPAAARDYTTPVSYTVSAADGGTKVYTVTVEFLPNTAKDIRAFGVTSPDANWGTITGTNIEVLMASGTNVTAMETVIVLSPNATVSPASGTAVDFTTPQIFTVSAEDGTTQDYLVTVTVVTNSMPRVNIYPALESGTGDASELTGIGYYVREEGSDDNVGSAVHPFKTLHKAVSAAHQETDFKKRQVWVIGFLTNEARLHDIDINMGRDNPVVIRGFAGNIDGNSSQLKNVRSTMGVMHINNGANLVFKDLHITGGQDIKGAGMFVRDAWVTLVGRAYVYYNRNTIYDYGSGVEVSDGGKFYMLPGSRIFRNNGTTVGGGLTVVYDGFVSLRGGSIYENVVLDPTNMHRYDNGSGGGVYLQDTAYMEMDVPPVLSDREEGQNPPYLNAPVVQPALDAATTSAIRGNTASYRGGGLYMKINTTLVKRGNGKIYGNTVQTESNRNHALEGACWYYTPGTNNTGHLESDIDLVGAGTLRDGVWTPFTP